MDEQFPHLLFEAITMDAFLPSDLELGDFVLWSGNYADFCCSDAPSRLDDPWGGRPCVSPYIPPKEDLELFRKPEKRDRIPPMYQGEDPIMPRRARVRVSQVKRLWNKQHGECLYCGGQLDDYFQIDHFVPVERGGDDTAGNLALSCRECNAKKNAKLPWDWDDWNGRYPVEWED